MPDPTNAPAPAPAAHAITVEPVISFARRARPGARCVLTVDLRHDCSPENWPYSDEEYELRCVLDARPLFSHKAVGDAAVVLHRYGGSYGPATFVLTASSEEMTGSIRIALVNRAGLLAETLELKDIRIARGAEPPPAQTFIRLQEQAIREPAPNAPLQEQAIPEPEPDAPLQRQAIREPEPDAPLQRQAIREPEPNAPLQQQTVGEPELNAPLRQQTVGEPEPNAPLQEQAANEPPPGAEADIQETNDEAKTKGILLADLRRFVKQCDIEPLSASDPRYVALSVARAEGVSDLGEDLANVIQLSNYPSTQIVCAQPGSGLTTDLLQLGARLERRGDLPSRVVHVDLEGLADVYRPVGVTDVLRAIAYRLDVEATQAEGGSPETALDYLSRLSSILQRADFPDSEGPRTLGASWMHEMRVNPRAHERVTRHLQSRFYHFIEETRESMADSVSRIERSLGKGRVVIVVDGLGKLSAARFEDLPEVERAAELLFGEQAHHLRLPCHAIYTAPLWLRYRMNLGLGFESTFLLPHVAVPELHTRPFLPPSPLTELVGRRIDVARVFGDSLEETLFPLLRASGGCLRDVLRLVRDVMIAAKSFPVGRTVVERTIDKHSESFSMAFRTPDIDMLGRFARNGKAHLEGEDPARFTHLIEINALLLRRSGDGETYEVHPLLLASREIGPLLRADSAL